MSGEVEYVVSAYGVMGFALVVYIIVAAMKRARLARESELVARLVRQRQDGAEDPAADAAATNLESVDS
jgi:heme exporter protein D